MFVYLSILYAFGHCNIRERHQTFRGTPPGPEEGREGVCASPTPREGIKDLGEISPSCDKLYFLVSVIDGVTKISMALR